MNKKNMAKLVLTFCCLFFYGCVKTETIDGEAAGANLEAVKLDPAKEYYNLGVAYMQQGKFDLSEARLRRSLEFKESEETYNALALLYENMFDNLSAEKTYETLISEYPDYALGFSNYMLFLCKYERWPQIEQIANTRKASAEVDAVTRIAAGNCYQGHNRMPEARAYYNQALTSVPLSAGALIPLAEIEYKEGYVTEAKTRIEMVLNQIGYSPKALYLAGLIAGDEGDAIKQREYFRTLRIRYPNSREARAAVVAE